MEIKNKNLIALLFVLCLNGVLGAPLKEFQCSDSPSCMTAPSNSKHPEVMELKMKFWRDCEVNGTCFEPLESKYLNRANCVNGDAGGYECDKVDLLAFLTLQEMGLRQINSDIWGWYDSEHELEYAIVCGFDAAAFVDITDTENPISVAIMPSSTGRGSTWCSSKTYNNFALIVRDSNNGHGVQALDLSNLWNLRMLAIGTGEIQVVSHDFLYTGGMGSIHNMVVSLETGFGYAVGSGTCAGGYHILDLHNLPQITYAGCYADDGYTHDAQCGTYNGPDARYVGREICFGYNEDSLTITDSTVKSNITMVSRTTYVGSQYTHQGWLTMDGRYMMMNDELDECCQVDPDYWSGCSLGYNRSSTPGLATTLIWDMQSLTRPILIGQYVSTETAIDHDNYIYPAHPNIVYQSNYCSGIRILDVKQISSGILTEIAYFDLEPECDDVVFRGTWANYLMPSGNLIATNMYRGMFILRAHDEIINN